MSIPEGLPLGTYEFTSPERDFRFHADPVELDFYVEASPHLSPARVEELLDLAFSWGLGLIPEDECEPETTDEGWTRIYLAPAEALDADEEEINRFGVHTFKDLGTLGMLSGLGAAACSALYAFSDYLDPTILVGGIA